MLSGGFIPVQWGGGGAGDGIVGVKSAGILREVGEEGTLCNTNSHLVPESEFQTLEIQPFESRAHIVTYHMPIAFVHLLNCGPLCI